jgi:hypothetical protein
MFQASVFVTRIEECLIAAYILVETENHDEMSLKV